ncbi:protein NO VEIN domain-containing protein [Nocardia grenadensis]
MNLIESAAPDLSVGHVAATRDGLGYDIAVSGESETHLEVKSTTVEEQLTIFLSQNEYYALHRDPDWQLVAVRLSRTARLPTAVATVPNDWI